MHYVVDPLLPFTDPVRRGIARSFYEIQAGLGIDQTTLADLLEVTEKQLTLFLQGRSDIDVTALYELADKLNITATAAMTGKFDFRAARTKILGVPSVIPDRYKEHARSRALTIRNILSFAEAHFGVGMKLLLLRSFQLDSSMFEDPKALVNQRLAIDLVNKLVAVTQDPSLPFRIGANSAQTIDKLGLSPMFSDLTSAAGVFDRILSKDCLQNLIENNRIWEIEKARHGLIYISSSIPDDLMGVIENEYLFSKTADQIRLGYISSMPSYARLKPVKVLIDDHASPRARSSLFVIQTLISA